MTLHLGGWDLLPPNFVQSAYVLIGDGSRFKQAVDDLGNVRFQDAALVGAQDVTLVMTVTGTPPVVLVGTFLSIEQPEVWLPLFSRQVGTEPPPSSALTIVSGKVKGATGENPVFVFVAGEGFSGGGPVAADGSFRFDVQGAGPGQVDLIAREEQVEGTPPFDKHVFVRAGRLRNVTLQRGQESSGHELSLDQAPDAWLHVTTTESPPYLGVVGVELRFHEGDLDFFSTKASYSLPFSVPSLAMTPPFDTTQRRLIASRGDFSSWPSGYARVEMPIDNGPTARLTFLSPMAPVSPELSRCGAPLTTSGAGLVLRWSIDARANSGQVEFNRMSAEGVPFSWRVVAPPSRTSFTLFSLPSDVSPVSTPPPGHYVYEMRSFFRGDVPSYASLFAQDVTPRVDVEERETHLQGCVNFQ